MMATALCWLMLTTFGASLAKRPNTKLPNIVIILADDLGWNDVSFHGFNQFLTPNIDALALSGIVLQNYYTQPICTPARAALLTGRHPIHNGMENDVIYAPQPWGLPLRERLLPQYLRRRGYVSRMVGKWHLGFFRANYTPTRRGFDSHYGTWLGHQDHYTHMGYEPHPGFDFHRGLKESWEVKGKYSTDLFTDEAEDVINNHDVNKPLFLYVAHTAPHAPLQAPQQEIIKFKYINDKKRERFAAMVTKLDESVGRITQALKNQNMLNNSIILFLSDNGGATNGFNGNVASNWPLRGCKDTLWEGGVRGVGMIWSPLLKAAPRVHHGLVNVQDWLPTLLSATSSIASLGSANPKNLDGVSQWEAINNQSTAPYQTMLHNIDPIKKIAALRDGKWKIISGRTYDGYYDGWYGKLTKEVPYNINTIRDSLAGRAVQTSPHPVPESTTLLALRAEATISCTQGTAYYDDPTECQPVQAPCLFNIEEDPCEKKNLASKYPEVLQQLVTKLKAYRITPPNNKPGDPRSYPVHWNNTWTTWMDFV